MTTVSCRLASRCLAHLCSIKTRKYGTSTYDGEGKTTASIVNDEPGLGVMINGYSQVGFKLNNGVTVLGPMAIFPRTVLSWAVADLNDITEESLSLFTVLEPKIDILVIGIGDRTKDLSFYTKLHPFAVKHKLNLEILPTSQACSTFNFLNSEGRYVAGALIPPQTVEASDEDIYRTKLRYHNIYEVE